MLNCASCLRSALAAFVTSTRSPLTSPNTTVRSPRACIFSIMPVSENIESDALSMCMSSVKMTCFDSWSKKSLHEENIIEAVARAPQRIYFAFISSLIFMLRYKLIFTPAEKLRLCGRLPRSTPCPITDVVEDNSGSEPKYLLMVKRLFACTQNSNPWMNVEFIGRL